MARPVNFDLISQAAETLGNMSEGNGITYVTHKGGMMIDATNNGYKITAPWLSLPVFTDRDNLQFAIFETAY